MAWKKVLWPILAIIGDGIVVVAITIATIWISGPDQLLPLQSAGGLVLVVLGLVVGLVLEWAAIALNLWTYKPAMQTISIGRVRFGISPILQMTLLPLLSVWLAQI